jgi:nucleoside-diphosphate-sugar epimerase
MRETILVTGGAGFIGSHLVDALLAQGHHVRVFDNLEPQVHGPLCEQGRWPDYCNPEAEYILGDVRDRDVLQRAMYDRLAVDGGKSPTARHDAGRFPLAAGQHRHAIVQPGAVHQGDDPFGAIAGRVRG